LRVAHIIYLLQSDCRASLLAQGYAIIAHPAVGCQGCGREHPRPSGTVSLCLSIRCSGCGLRASPASTRCWRRVCWWRARMREKGKRGPPSPPLRREERVRMRGDQHPLPKLNSTISKSASSTTPSQFTSTRPRLLPLCPKANSTANRSASSTQPLASTSPL
jgi:hypothetical protein